AEVGNGFYHQDFDDSGMLTITYEDGAFATIDTSWSRPQKFPKGDVTLEVIGTKGVAQADLFTQNLTVYSKTSELSAPHYGTNVDYWMVDGFLRASAGEKVPELATGRDGLHALEVALAAYRSAQQHAPVSVQPVPAK
ncbi:MAG: Gfo/Idh/MocA family oxidoreductase, partial [Terriglobales bacterium]